MSTQPTGSEELHQLPATKAAALIRAGEISSEDLVRSCLERIEAREPTVQAWQFLDPEQALAAARARDAEEPRGLLHGVPVGLKDVIETAAMPTEYGTPIYAGHRPEADARCVELLEASGAVLLGKTVTTELATWTPSRTRNPHDPEHTPGGSSSGSAAAVGDRMVPLALGTQTVGSTIRPATFCGVLAMKPTHDAVDLRGVNRTSEVLDTIGVFGRTPGDIRATLVVLGALDSTRGLVGERLRVAAARTPWWSQADADSRAAFETAVEALAAAGVEVSERELPARMAAINEAHDVVATYDIAAYCAKEYDEHRDLLSERMRTEIERGRAIERGAYEAALREVEACAEAFESCFGEVDAFLTPAVTGEAPRGLDWTGDPVFCRPWSMLGAPAATVPVLRGANGLPVGVQLVSRLGGDRVVIEAQERLFDALGEAASPLPPA